MASMEIRSRRDTAVTPDLKICNLADCCRMTLSRIERVSSAFGRPRGGPHIHGFNGNPLKAGHCRHARSEDLQSGRLLSNDIVAHRAGLVSLRPSSRWPAYPWLQWKSAQGGTLP